MPRERDRQALERLEALELTDAIHLARMHMIHRDRLYRVRSRTWEGYARQTYGVGRQQAYREAQAGEIVCLLASGLLHDVAAGNVPNLDTFYPQPPDREGVARPLARLLRRGGSKEEVRNAWLLAVALAEDVGRPRPTARIVLAAIAIILGGAGEGDEGGSDKMDRDLELIVRLMRLMRSLSYDERDVTVVTGAVQSVLGTGGIDRDEEMELCTHST